MRTLHLLPLVLPALLALAACKGGEGDGSSSTGEEPHCSAGWGDGPEVDPDHPPCGCDLTCDNGGMCRFTGDLDPASWKSSICHPACTCPTPGDNECAQNDCPMLGSIQPVCLDGRCVITCDNSDPCPSGYVCSGNNTCEVKLE
jgi:hypothetical protein